MNTEIIIKKTITRVTPSGDRYLVCRGKLISIPVRIEKATCLSNPLEWIVISETEDINDEDWAYDTEDKILFQVKENTAAGLLRSADKTFIEDACYKVLGLPEHISVETLQDITNGILQDGHIIWVECERQHYFQYSNGETEKTNLHTGFSCDLIKITDNNVHIFSIKEHESWYDIIVNSPIHFAEGDFKTMVEYLSEKYNTPTRKS